MSWKQKGFLMSPHPLTNFEIKKYLQNNPQRSSKNEPRFNGVYLRDNLPKIKDGTYVIIFMSTLILELIGLLCTHQIIVVLILIVLEFNTFQKKLKHLLINQQL